MTGLLPVVVTTTEVQRFLEPLLAQLGVRHPPLDCLQLFTIGLARWVPIFALTPFLGGRLVPAPVKMALSVLLAAWVLPQLSSQAPVPLEMSTLAWWTMLLQEVFVGFVLATGAGLLFWTAEMGGKFLDNVRGTTTANLLIPQVSVQSSLLGDFYFQLFIVLYLFAGGHLWFLGAVFESYELYPPLIPGMNLEPVAQGFIVGTAHTLVLAVKLIAPALVVLMLMDVMLGVANRMAPQLDVFFISLSLKSSVGALIVALSIYFVFFQRGEWFADHHLWLESTVSGLGSPGS